MDTSRRVLVADPRAPDGLDPTNKQMSIARQTQVEIFQPYRWPDPPNGRAKSGQNDDSRFRLFCVRIECRDNDVLAPETLHQAIDVIVGAIGRDLEVVR